MLYSMSAIKFFFFCVGQRVLAKPGSDEKKCKKNAQINTSKHKQYKNIQQPYHSERRRSGGNGQDLKADSRRGGYLGKET